DAALNSTYDGEKAFTCLAHLEGLSSLSVITGNFVAGDVNVVGGTNLSCDFVGSSCVVSGNRILGVVVINENGRKNCVTGNVITAPVAATDYPKTWPFSSYPPDPSNVIANNVVDGSVI
ncbi:MAG TPA: hypothetical protein PLK94_07465, partial [Alphaproteobacteria bacterium]|nr:hypothetical protein [Alphaproteobacteria bacterium]